MKITIEDEVFSWSADFSKKNARTEYQPEEKEVICAFLRLMENEYSHDNIVKGLEQARQIFVP